MRSRFPRLRPDPVLIQAVIAAAISFAHIHDIAEAAGQGGWKAWAYPISVDLLLVAAWRKMRSTKRSLLGWSWFLVALVASLGANVATAGLLDMTALPVWLKVVVGGWPAVAFLGGTLLVHTKAVAPAPVDNAEQSDDEPTDVPADVDECNADPVNVPDHTTIVTAQEAAQALGVAPATVRGWVSGDSPKVAHRGYDDKGRTLVDLLECRARVVAAK